MVHHAAHASEKKGTHRGAGRHKKSLSRSYEMSVVWDELCLFSRGRHTHTPTVCSDNSVRWDRRIQVPHKHILLTAGTWSSLSHDSALTREEQTETWKHTHDCSKAGRGRLLHLSVNYSKGKAQHAFLVIKQQERVEAVCCSLTVVQFPQNKLEFPRGMLGNAK